MYKVGNLLSDFGITMNIETHVERIVDWNCERVSLLKESLMVLLFRGDIAGIQRLGEILPLSGIPT